jgi:hypothetical protein
MILAIPRVPSARPIHGQPDRDRTIMPFYNRGRNRLTDRSVVGVQVLGGHELRHQGALADRGGAQHQDAIRRWTLRRAALPRARQ